MPSSHDLALALQEALRPLYRRLDQDRSISVGKLGMLGHLARHGRASAADLSHVLRISPQAVTFAVKELEAATLVSRSHDEHDGRRQWITLTDAGRARYAEELGKGGDWLVDALQSRLSDADRAALEAALPALVALTQERRESPAHD